MITSPVVTPRFFPGACLRHKKSLTWSASQNVITGLMSSPSYSGGRHLGMLCLWGALHSGDESRALRTCNATSNHVNVSLYVHTSML